MTANQTFLKTMISGYFGTKQAPFETDTELKNELLPHQRECYTRVQEQAFLGGFTLVIGGPGTGKTIFKQALTQLPNKSWNIIVINRAISTWMSFLSLLAQALELELKNRAPTMEKAIIAEARKLNQRGKSLLFIIDDAHLVPQDTLKRIRLLLEDFPRNHNLVLIGQNELMGQLRMRENEEILSRVTNSAEFKPLGPQDIAGFIHRELDRCGLPHNTFTHEALNLIIKASAGNLRATKNLCVGSMVEAIRRQTKTIDIKEVNIVLDQPHWRKSNMLEGREPVVFTNQRPNYQNKDMTQ